MIEPRADDPTNAAQRRSSAPHDKIWYTEDPDDTDEVDWSKWRGLIHAKSLPDLEVIAHAKSDIEALIAEVELLRSLMNP